MDCGFGWETINDQLRTRSAILKLCKLSKPELKNHKGMFYQSRTTKIRRRYAFALRWPFTNIIHRARDAGIGLYDLIYEIGQYALYCGEKLTYEHVGAISVDMRRNCQKLYRPSLL